MYILQSITTLVLIDHLANAQTGRDHIGIAMNTSSGSYYNDEDRVRAALSFISPSDREVWVQMAYAIKHGLGEAGFDIWDAWSQGAKSYDNRAAKAVWKSVPPAGRVSLGTLFWRAEQHGFDPSEYLAQPISQEEDARRRAERERRESEARAQAEVKRERAALAASKVWNAAVPVAVEHPYLSRKGVQPVPSLREIDADALKQLAGYAPNSDGMPLQGSILVAPVKVDGKVSSIEFIDADGRKSALAGGAKSGGYWASGPLTALDGQPTTIAIGEGLATMLSVHAATGVPVVAGLSCHNLPKVAKLLREQYPQADLVVLADRGNGQEHAERAAREAGARFAVPAFASHEHIDGNEPTDFNDLARLRGLDAVTQAVASASVIPPDAKEAPPSDPVRIQDHSGKTLYEHTERVQIGVAVETAVRLGVSLAGAVLPGANLDDRDLAGANMANADLRAASMRNADVEGAIFRGADLSGSNLTGTNVRQAEMDGANLAGATGVSLTTKETGGPELVLRGVKKLDNGAFDTTVLLFKGKGNYLQGFVKIGDEKHQVVAHINERKPDPETGELRPNFLTLVEAHGNGDDTKWKELGFGNAVNQRRDGKPVYFDEVLFKVGGELIKARTAKHVGGEMHQQLGFQQPRQVRPTDELKDAPRPGTSRPKAAAPAANEAAAGARKPRRSQHAAA
jgi:phage/plasmid primase-like uncharacterized protein